MTTNTKCSACNGTGHDKASKPVVKFEKEEIQKFNEHGEVTIETKLRHKTISQGSGCIQCGGKVVN